MAAESLYERLAAAASLQTDDGAIRIRASYEPGAGATAKVSPPTYPADGRDSPYILEDRLGPSGVVEKVVLLDSRQSQANRCEEALQGAIDDGLVAVPRLVLDVKAQGRPIPPITSLTAPHRSRDAYFRDAQAADGTPFDKTEAGAALAECTPADATALFRFSPADLVYGVWDSHRGRRLQAKFPRVYTSELVGLGAVSGARAAGRYDMLTSGARKVTGGDADWAPDDKGKRKLSEMGLGSIPPSVSRAGGVTVRAISRDATLSFAGLARVRAGADANQQRAARGVLAALALLGDRLAFGASSVFLRSGCDLVLTSEELSWIKRGGINEPFQLSVDTALAVLGVAVERMERAGLPWPADPIRLTPQPKLQHVIDEAFLSAPDKDE